jgi:hypothetical protein
MEEIIWTDRVRNEEALQKVKVERNILQTIKRGKANWIGDIFCANWPLKQAIEGKLEGRIEVMGGRGRRRKQLLDVLKEKSGYCKFIEEALVWKNHCGRGYGSL